MFDKIKYYRIPIMFITGIIVFIGIFIFFVVNTGEKTPLTCEQFEETANSLGYDTMDTTTEYDNLGNTLVGSRKIVSDDFRFEYFEFTSSDSSESLFASTYQKIIGKRSQHDAEYSSYYNNYNMYGLRSKGKYYVVMYVGNTSVYGECKEEYMVDIYNILEGMNYNPKNNENKQ